MKRISNFLLLILLSGILFTACVKDRNVGPDFSSTQPMLELKTPINNIAGQAYFTRAVIGNLSDTVQFYVNLAATNAADRDINVTIGVDQQRLDDYNADTTNALKYELLPDSDYVLLKTSGTIVKGQHIDSFQVAFFKDKIDQTKNYMLPIGILDGDGIEISQNQGAIYFHAIGNPISGNYSWEWIRWNASDTSGAPTYDFDYSPAAFSPVNPTTINVESGSGGLVYNLTFDNNGGVLSNFQVSFTPESVASAAAGGITITSGPVIEVADPATGTYRFYFTYDFGGNPRQIIDQYIKY